jgi:predicted membrane channel-forming protein YqfA (hemolysin III family)
MNEIILMLHVVFGIACMVAAVWLFVDVLHASERNLARIRRVSWAAALAMWTAFLVGGYFYVTAYKADKEIILAEKNKPWHFAHELVMETKEHLVIILLLLATYLPIVAANNLATNKDARKLMLWLTATIAVFALVMDGEGALIAMGVKMGLLAK